VKFLSQAEVLRIHGMLIDLYGGAPGLRDPGLLASALAQPEASFGGAPLHPTVAAAAYGFHIARNHAFVDGNKRIALAAMLVFLEVNGKPLVVEQEELYAVMMAVSDGRWSKETLTAWLGDHLS
jgi:death-on-curing protein